MIEWKLNVGTLIHLMVLVVSMVGIYWRLRELIFALHRQNQETIHDLTAVVGAMDVKVNSLWKWWEGRLERRPMPRGGADC